MARIFAERYSTAALWCQRCAVFLVPYFAVVIVLYRFEKVETAQLFALLGVGFLIALTALVLAFRAVAELWSRGYRGGSKVVRGLFITIMVLLPFGYHAYLSLEHPLANDVSTDGFNPPDYINAEDTRAQMADQGVNAVGNYDRPHALTILSSYPQLQPRRYPAGPERVLEAVRFIIQENEWPITGSQGIPEARPEVTDEELEDNKAQGDDEPDQESVDDAAEVPDDIYLEFLERTLVFGFENDVVVRIVSEDRNTVVDIRSSSRWGSHDFGYNARLIGSFLSQLDEALLGIAGEG